MAVAAMVAKSINLTPSSGRHAALRRRLSTRGGISPASKLMNRLPTLLTTLLSAGMLSSCMLPRNHAEVMHGKVHGGDVPLYKTGSMDDFFRAGLILPDIGGYVRAEFDVLDLGADGRVRPSNDDSEAGPSKTVAQIAIPSLVSSYDLSRSSCEMRAACPTDQDTSPLRHTKLAPPPATIAASLDPAIPMQQPAAPATIAATVEPKPVEAPPPLVASAAAAPPRQIRPPSSARWGTNSYFQIVHLP